MERNYYDYKETYIKLKMNIESLLYEPLTPNENTRIGVVVLHSHGNYLRFSAGAELAKRGFRVLCSATKGEGETMENKLLDVKVNVEFMREQKGIDKIILLSHSGGASLISCYQTVAEKGTGIHRVPERIVPLGDVGELPAGDAVVFLDSNWGNGILTLLSMDPAVTSETSGRGLNPEYDLYDPKNGYNPEDPLGSDYSEEFIRKYLRAQKQRNDAVVNRALVRLEAINAGYGDFEDDEPFFVPGGAVTTNKLFPLDLRLLCRTKKERDLLHADGSVTRGIVPMIMKPIRRPKNPSSFTMNMQACRTTVKSFLTNYSVRATDELYYDADTLYGIDYDSTFCSTTANVRFMDAPTLLMGMTGGYGVCNNEHIFENLAAKDKTLMYVEGATHMFTPNKDVEAYPGQFGDTVKLVYDYVDEWVNSNNRI